MGIGASRHSFTTEQMRKGGWARARFWAGWRRENPSPSEHAAQEILRALGVGFETEYEIVHETGRPQWIDIYVPERRIAIEIDGSHGWHSWNSGGSKMDLLDEIKARWCEAHSITFVSLTRKDLTEERFREILGF